MGASTSTVPSSPAASSASTNSALTVGELTLVDDAYETKMAAFESDCNDGKGEALPCHQTAEFYSVVKEDRARSAKLYERNCREKGYPASCFNLGKLHLAGKGVPQDDATAEKLFAKACKGGHLSGCYHQGLLMYLAEQTKHQQTNPPQPKKLPTGPPSSSSAKPDDAAVPAATTAPAKKVRLTWRQADAIRLLEKTCAAGEHDSCYFAGSHFLNRDMADRAPRKAVALLERSCAGNHAPSCFNLAVLFKKGDDGVPPDAAQFERYSARTKELAKLFGGIGGQRTA